MVDIIFHILFFRGGGGNSYTKWHNENLFTGLSLFLYKSTGFRFLAAA